MYQMKKEQNINVVLDYLNCLTDSGRAIIKSKEAPEIREQLRKNMLSSMVAVLEPKHKYQQAENN